MGAVSFKKLTPGDLHTGAIVPQAIDNQWVPSRTLRRLIRKGQPLVKWQRTEESKRLVLSEWRRALIYAPQVVVNRASLFNNTIIVNDYSGADKPHFQELLSRNVIVEYLLTEESPDQKPSFDISEDKWQRWLHLIQDTELACVRLDWGNQEDDFRNVAAIFHDYIQTLNTADRAEHLTNALRIPNSRKKEFRQKLTDIVQYAVDVASRGQRVTRNELYRKFICQDTSPVDEGWYDSGKPFAAELKEIFDLRYIVNLPDALGRYAFTPKGSPDRTLLGETNPRSLGNQLKDNQIEELIQSIRRLHFAIIGEGLYLRGLDRLSLANVVQIRQTDEWEKYISSLKRLFTSPFEFENQVERLTKDFIALNRRITEVKIREAGSATTSLIHRWQPLMSIILTIGNASMKFFSHPDDPSRILVETTFAPITTGLAPLVLNWKSLANQYVDLGLSINFLRSQVKNGREIWREIRGALEGDPRFRFLEEHTLNKQEANQSKGEEDLNPDEII